MDTRTELLPELLSGAKKVGGFLSNEGGGVRGGLTFVTKRGVFKASLIEL